MGGYDQFIFLLFFVFQILYVSVLHPCCFVSRHEFVSYVLSCRIMRCLMPVPATYINGLSVSVVLSRCFICYHVNVAAMRYLFCVSLSCVSVMLHVSCFHAFDIHIQHMLLDHMFYIVMDIVDVMISIFNNLLYVIIMMLIYGIKMTWKLPIFLTIQKPNYRHFLSEVLLLC